MAKKPGKLEAMQDRAAKASAAMGVATAAEPKKKTSPAQFFREVRLEGKKISWPSRQETWITSVMVFLMVVLASMFFGVLDIALRFIIAQILKLA